MEEIMLLVVVNRIFHVPVFLSVFMISFEYELILLKYSSADSVLFLSPLTSNAIQFLLQILFTLAGL